MNDEIKEILKEIECYQNEDMCIIMLSQKENKALLDYITNLQQENERLKHQLKVQEDLTIKNRLRKHIYKSRCEEAIEYVKRHDQTYFYLGECELLNILQNGEDNK